MTPPPATREAEAQNAGTPVILIVDDEEDILDLLQYNLRRAGFETRLARDGVEALEAAEAGPPDLVILDVMMPRMDGIEACRRLRQSARLRHVPIMMLTARSEEETHVRGLDVGADIYLTKPISIPVLLSQAKALLRGAHRYETPPDLLRIHDLEIDRDRYLVYRARGGERETLRFPRKEFELLRFLAARPGKVFTRQVLLDQVWGRDVYVVDRTVDVHVRKIREKLGDGYIETVKGVGYRFRG
jgi:two-component system alkaline phosphatase synthesis response regulator PhoP